MKKINALVTSVGGIVAQGIIKSLKYHNKYQNNTGHRYEIVGTDINYEAAGLYRVHKFSLVTKPSDRNYLKTILELCIKNKIHVLFIGSDVELPILCKYREKIENITGAKVITSRENVVDMCRDKYLTYQFLEKNNLNAIPTCLPDDMDLFLKEEKFPLVVKPREGFGSKLFQLVSNHDELDFAIRSIENANWKPMIQKYLKNDSKEYTTGITVDKDGRKVMSSITMRKVLKHGQTYKAFIDYFPQVKKICNRIASSLDTEGPINIQSRLDTDDKKVKIIEINSRFSASCPMRTVAGINEPDIITRNVLFNEKIKIEKYRPLICMRYWNETYVDKEKLDKVKSKKSTINKLNSEIFDYF
ncbi:carbamoyl phosphate synthase [Candidatus Nitrosocosmicus sp.]|nr:carbamoyl phosphate synthase [Candidatus Nitrosocosmicus sp.]